MKDHTITINLIYKDGSKNSLIVDYELVAEAEIVIYNGDSFRYSRSPGIKFAEFEQVGKTVLIQG